MFLENLISVLKFENIEQIKKLRYQKTKTSQTYFQQTILFNLVEKIEIFSIVDIRNMTTIVDNN